MQWVAADAAGWGAADTDDGVGCSGKQIVQHS